MSKTSHNLNPRTSLRVAQLTDIRPSKSFSLYGFSKAKSTYQTTAKGPSQNHALPLTDKKLLKELLKKLAAQQDSPNTKQEVAGRLAAFSAEIDGMEAENKRLNLQLEICRQELQAARGQVRFYSNAIKEKDNYMLTLKGKLYEKDENLRELNSRLYQVIETMQMTPMKQQYSLSRVSKLIHQEHYDLQASFSSRQSNQLCMRIAGLEAENIQYTERISAMEKLLAEGNNREEELSNTINELTNERTILKAKLSVARLSEANKQGLIQNLYKQIEKLQALSADELSRTSIKDLEQVRAVKDAEIQKLNTRIVSLESEVEQGKNLLMEKVQEINSLRMELKLSQDILQVEIETNKEKTLSKSVLHKERMEKLASENESLKQQVASLKEKLKAANTKKSPFAQAISIILEDQPNLQEMEVVKDALESKVEQLTQDEIRSKNEILQLKEVVSRLEGQSSQREQKYAKQLQEYESIVFPSLYRELESERESRVRCLNMCEERRKLVV